MCNIGSLTLVHEGNDEGLLSLAAEPGNRENHAFLRQETPVEYTGTMEWWEDAPPLGAKGGLNLCRLERTLEFTIPGWQAKFGRCWTSDCHRQCLRVTESGRNVQGDRN